jgi:PIN domain nuclease of toxin-antitoxin system
MARRRGSQIVNHSDPFDRMLVAQAMSENLTLVTHDRAFSPYGVAVIWT